MHSIWLGQAITLVPFRRCAGSTFLLGLSFSANLILILQVGLGWSAAMGSGLVVVRGDRGHWSPPSALAMASVGWGLQAGGALHDLLIVLRNRWVLFLINSVPAHLVSGQPWCVTHHFNADFTQESTTPGMAAMVSWG